MPSTNAFMNNAYDQRFLMLPVSPARSTDSQIDSSGCSSKELRDADMFITEVQTGSLQLVLFPTELGGTSSPLQPVFRPTAWDHQQETHSLSRSPSSQEISPASSTTQEDYSSSFWMIQRSSAFDEDEDEDISSLEQDEL